MRNRKWNIAIGVGAAALIVGGAAGVANADAFATSTDRVDGYNNINDDWNDHEREVGILCDGCETSVGTDLVTLWQSVLAVEGHLTVDQINGDFRGETAKATAKFQDSYGLEPTGEVDQATWALADDNLTMGDDGYTVTYGAAEGEGAFDMERDPDDGDYGLFGVTDADGNEAVNGGDGSILLLEGKIVLEPADS